MQCPNCKNTVKDGSKYCQYCRTKLDQVKEVKPVEEDKPGFRPKPVSAPPVAESKKGNKKFLISMIAEGVALIVVVIMLIMSMGGGSNNVAGSHPTSFFNDFSTGDSAHLFSYAASGSVSAIDEDFYCIKLIGELYTKQNGEDDYLDYGLHKESIIEILQQHADISDSSEIMLDPASNYVLSNCMTDPSFPPALMRYGTGFVDNGDFFTPGCYYDAEGNFIEWPLIDFGNNVYTMECTLYVSVE